tara:strand:+ start:102 stop:236 length:135 start_codon:yes stop_codon:yes gene_type:complete
MVKKKFLIPIDFANSFSSLKKAFKELNCLANFNSKQEIVDLNYK